MPNVDRTKIGILDPSPHEHVLDSRDVFSVDFDTEKPAAQRTIAKEGSGSETVVKDRLVLQINTGAFAQVKRQQHFRHTHVGHMMKGCLPPTVTAKKVALVGKAYRKLTHAIKMADGGVRAICN